MGPTTIPVPGDAKIDGNLDKADAPIPTHAGMTWVHTIGENLYDTPSGDLEVGVYAVQADGSYIQHAPPFVSSTSTPAQLMTSAATGAENGTPSTPSGVVSPPVSDTSTSTAPRRPTVPIEHAHKFTDAVYIDIDMSDRRIDITPFARHQYSPGR